MLSYGFATLLFLVIAFIVFNLGAIALKLIIPKQNLSWAILAVGFVVESTILKIASGGINKIFTGNIPNDDAFLLVIITVFSIAALIIVHTVVNKIKSAKEKA